MGIMIKDRTLQALMAREVRRQQSTIDLIASENYVSPDVLAVLGSPLTNKYSEGYPNRRYYPGNELYDEIELLAIERACRAFGLDVDDWHVNVQPYSGSPANVEVYLALVPPGETIMGMALASGGHLTHGHPVSASGKFWHAVQYSVAPSGFIDYDAIEQLARETKPKLIVCGFTAYPRHIDFARFRAIADTVGAYLMADISHIAGLVVGGVDPSPFPYADVVMTTTHKTMRGPRGAVIFANRQSGVAKKAGVDIAAAIDKAVFPGMQGGPHNNVTAAKAVAFWEALSPGFRKYAAQIVKNAKALAAEFVAKKFILSTGGTDTHLLLLDVRPFGLDGRAAEERLEAAGITANRNSLPGDEKPLRPSGVRIGTPSVTTRGMKEREMKLVASYFERLFVAHEDPKRVLRDVNALCKKFPLPYR